MDHELQAERIAINITILENMIIHNMPSIGRNRAFSSVKEDLLTLRKWHEQQAAKKAKAANLSHLHNTLKPITVI